MKLKKFLAGSLAIVAIAAAIAGAAYAKADNDKNNGRGNDHEGIMVSANANMKALGSKVEIAISDNGRVRVGGAKITGISGNTISAVSTFGSVNFNWTVNTDADTQFARKSGGGSGLAEMSVGDMISFSGMLDTGASSLTVKASAVKDLSIQKRNVGFSGTVQSVNSADASFVLGTEDHGSVTVKTTGATQIKKGSAAGVFADILVNAKVSASGLWNNMTNVLEANEVRIKIPEVSLKTTLEGTVKTAPAGPAPTTFVLTSGGVDYTVRVAADTSILNVLWLHTGLLNLRAGDNVRVYGMVNADNTIDATVVRDTSIHI